MVEDWRERWEDEFSFYYVQLANFRAPTTEPGVESHWVTVQDEMRRALASIPKSGMAVANDIGEADDIHPRNKREVGERLSRIALSKDYEKKGIVTSGPLFEKAEVAGETMILSFKHSTGLKSRDGERLKRFEIRSEEGSWEWAEEARIDGEQVIVSSSKVEEPYAVRYAWAQNPHDANLVNEAGLPAVFSRPKRGIKLALLFLL
jgi:sialate O-acetylesterase